MSSEPIEHFAIAASHGHVRACYGDPRHIDHASRTGRIYIPDDFLSSTGPMDGLGRRRDAPHMIGKTGNLMILLGQC